MPHAKIEPSGCDIVKDIAKLRIDCFLNETDPHYDKHYVRVPVITEPYPGAVLEDSSPVDQADYDAWVESLPHIWQNNPFHSHKIWLPAGASDNYIKEQIERTLNYFYQFHQHCWDENKKFIDEWKKVPFKKGSIRDIFEKGDPKDSLANQQKLADILSRKDEFQVGVSRVPPTDLNIGEKGTIDVGAPAINRTSYFNPGNTVFGLENPSNADGTIDTVTVWSAAGLTGFKTGTLSGSGTSYTSRDSETLGNIAYGENPPFTGLSIDVLTSDYIGCYYATGYGIEKDGSGYAGIYYKAGDQFGAGSQTYSLLSGDAISLYGTGTEGGGATEKFGADTGTGADARASGSPAAEVSGSETGSGADALPARDIALPDTGVGADAFVSLQTPAAKAASDTGSGVDACVSLQTPVAKTSSDAGSGVEVVPVPVAFLAGSESGSGIEAFIARLLAAAETGCGAEASEIGGGGLLKHLFASELGEGADGLTAKIEKPTKGGGMRLWI